MEEVVDINELMSSLSTQNKEMDKMDIASDDDYVVEEVDVFWSTELADQLCLFQHPLRPVEKPYPQEKLSALRFKPTQYKFEMDFALDTEGEYYEPENQVVEQQTKMSLSSSEVSLKTNYAIAASYNHALHLTPLSHVVQYRPSFKYIDESDAKKKATKTKEEKEEDVVELEDGETVTPLKPVQVQFKKKETQKAMQKKKPLHEDDGEPWINLSFREEDDPETTVVFQKLIATSQVQIPVELSKNQYLDSINPLPSDEANSHIGSMINEGLSALQKLPLDKQILTLLSNVSILQFSKLKEILTVKNENDILNTLDKYAVLVRGCWVLKSEHWSDNARLRLVRDFLLLLFQEREYVKRKEFAESVNLPSEVVKEMLQSIAINISAELGWKLKTEPDSEFLVSYPDIVERFQVNWKERGKLIRESLAALATKIAQPTENVASKFVGNSQKEQTENFLQGVFKKWGVLNMEVLKVKFKELQQEKDARNLIGGASDDYFAQTLMDLAGNLHGAFYLKKQNTGIDKYRTVALDLFSQKKTIKKADISSACRKQLGEEMPGNLYIKVLREFATVKASVWTFKSGNASDEELIDPKHSNANT